MTTPPVKPCIYHITHFKNLSRILAEGALLGDAAIRARGGPAATIGYDHIKERRLTMPVSCHAGTHVGDYVPFYFCPRSVMLYVISRGGQGQLAYAGGQDPILHLEADLHRVIEWADREERRWAFTKSNAGAFYAESWSRVGELGQVNWDAVRATQWAAPEVKEAKQAEFLIHEAFPWALVSRVGVRSMQIQERAEALIAGAGYATPVHVIPQWYY